VVKHAPLSIASRLHAGCSLRHRVPGRRRELDPRPSRLIVDLGSGDGGHAGKVHDGQRGREYERAASLDMVASDRSTDAGRMTGWLLGGDGWPAGQLPPATGRSRSTPAVWWASATRKPCLGGLLSPLGDALVGQRLAQPGMLVVHFPAPSSSSACLFQ
jgi:hypothetical protein